MCRTGRSFALALLCCAHLNAQAPEAAEIVIDNSPGVTPPQVIKKVDPSFSRQAEHDHIQGTILLRLVVTPKGLPSGITVLNPLGHGLDEEAIAAIEKWRFKPAMKGGEPVAMRATIEVGFHSTGRPFDGKSEKQRIRFNTAVQTLTVAAASPAGSRALKDVLRLADQEYAPAMYLAGRWEMKGSGVPKNFDHGLALVQKAADKRYVPAMYHLAAREMEGRDVPADPKRGMDLMQQAAGAGSADAQYYLGDSYQNGKGVTAEPESALRYFRSCAAQNNAVCQYRLGRMLLDAADDSARDHEQAIAWLELAGATLPEARESAAREAVNLSPEQARSVASLKACLVHK